MFIETVDSTAVDCLTLGLISREVKVFWISGGVGTYQVRRRDQVRLLAMRLLAPEDLSYGRFANWAKYGATFA